MARNRFLDKEWQEKHIKKIKNLAGPRYSPELNVDIPIAEIFDGISRTKTFYYSTREQYGKLNRTFSCISEKYENSEDQKLYNDLKIEISQLSQTLDKIKSYDTEPIPWNQINKLTQKANQILWEFLDKLREEKNKAEKQKSEEVQSNPSSASERLGSTIHSLYETQRELRYFEKLSSSTKAKLSNSPFLLLTGVAGTGKTHLLCDVIENRFKNGLPAVLVFGELFATSDDPFKQIIRQLGLKINKRQFLSFLNNAGEQSGCRAILIIDALNETRQRNFWKRNLSKVIDEIKKYPHIALIVSIRTGFEDEVITKKLIKALVHEEHRGFEFREWEAVSKFFKEFQLPLPEIPLLMPEFQNPLFLLLFCKAIKERSRKSKDKEQKQVFRGHEGATYIFESFVDGVSKKIAQKFNIPNSSGKNIWDTIIEKIAEGMVKKNDDRISEDEVIALVKAKHPSIDHGSLIKELERNLLIVKVPRYSKEKNDYDGFDFRFPFQKFSDHLIGRYIFKKYEREFGKANKNLQTAKKFFSKRRKLGKFLANSWNRGIVEALSIQCPEHLKGREFVEVAPYLKSSPLAQEAFVESLIWRKPTAFSTNRKNTLAYINSEIIKTESGHNNLLNAFLTVAPIPNHPFNADFLHSHLSKFTMPKRDSWWSTFLHYQYGERGAVDRLVEWGWSDQDKSHINDESIRLCSVALCWFLTTPNRFLRDKATKALVALLTNRLSVILELLKQFKDVNDPYVAERLYAVAYGCAIRSKSDKQGLKALAQWVYDEIFKDGNPPVHILLRDYARGIIEVALHENIKIAINRNKIEPPYNSERPEKVPLDKLLQNKYYPEDFFQDKTKDRGFLDIWSSVMYDYNKFPGDFGKYIINPEVSNWSGRRLNSKEINRKKIFNDFKDGLTKQQRKLLEKAMDPFFSVDLSSILASIKYVAPDEVEKVDKKEVKQQEKEQKKEMKKAYADFINSLSEEKKKFFDKEIKPFLNSRGGIDDPLEYFDTGLAQRWVFNRVVQLGWEPKLHGEFDKYVNYDRVGRSEHKPERIGKKYQWIALHELLARISDNFEFKGENWTDSMGKYEGPWQLGIRDIDPTCILKEFPNTKPEHIPNFKWEIQSQYNAWHKNRSHSAWLKKSRDLPDPKKIIEFIDESGIAWISLEGFITWQEETPPEQEKYNLPTRTLWYIIKSYLVRAADKDKVFNWAKQQHFMRGWMPESHEFYNVYLGEYPWSPAFLYHNIPYYHHDGWVDGSRDRKIPARILVTDDQYLSSGSSIDCSTSRAISVKLPAKFLVDEMELAQNYVDGRFFDKDGNLVAFYPPVFDEKAPSCVLIRKDKLVNFFQVKKYNLVWTLLGEKNIIGGGRIGQPLGWLEIDGAYTLNGRYEIVGIKKTSFKKIKVN
jgi:chromosomal replication initiation ATPase DnaA